MANDSSLLNLPGRDSVLSREGSFRKRWPNAATLIDRVAAPIVRFLESRLPDRVYVQRQYREIVGAPLNLDRPRTLSEKIQWLKLYDATPLHTRCADKIRVRDYVRERLGAAYLIPALLTTDRLSDITPERIVADNFVLKTNHDSGGVVICRDRSTFDWIAARRKLRLHLRRRFWKIHRERAYKDIRPGIIVEALLKAPDGGDPKDYKLFCFHGRVALIQVVSGRWSQVTRTMHDLNWSVLPVRRRGVPRSESAEPRPARLAEMIEIAENLSQPFKFCRVDLYEVDGRIFFGEITFYPEAGYRPFEPPEFEQRLGDMLRLD